jgi:hypothetical protein
MRGAGCVFLNWIDHSKINTYTNRN